MASFESHTPLALHRAESHFPRCGAGQAAGADVPQALDLHTMRDSHKLMRDVGCFHDIWGCERPHHYFESS